MTKVISELPKTAVKTKRYLIEFDAGRGDWLNINQYHRFLWTARLSMWSLRSNKYDQRIVDLHSDED